MKEKHTKMEPKRTVYKETGDKKQNYRKTEHGKSEHKKQEYKKNTELACPVQKKCGACNYLSVDYDKQLKKKQQDLEQLLHPFGKVEGII